MASSGKYDFQGLKKLGAAGLRLALAASPYTSWVLAGGPVTDFFLEWFSNWLANNGLMILDTGADIINGAIDQKEFDDAMDDAIKEITHAGGAASLTPEQKKEIDDKVIAAGRKFVVIGKS